jgi:hypothetical protein
VAKSEELIPGSCITKPSFFPPDNLDLAVTMTACLFPLRSTRTSVFQDPQRLQYDELNSKSARANLGRS